MCQALISVPGALYTHKAMLDVQDNKIIAECNYVYIEKCMGVSIINYAIIHTCMQVDTNVYTPQIQFTDVGYG